MELKRTQSNLPSVDNIPSRVRYSTNQFIHRKSMDGDKPNRRSLNLRSLDNSRVSLPNQEVIYVF